MSKFVVYFTENKVPIVKSVTSKEQRVKNHQKTVNKQKNIYDKIKNQQVIGLARDNICVKTIKRQLNKLCYHKQVKLFGKNVFPTKAKDWDRKSNVIDNSQNQNIQFHPLRRYLGCIDKNSKITNIKKRKQSTTNILFNASIRNQNQETSISDEDFLWKQDIENTYEAIGSLKLMGYLDKKITQWLWKYLQGKKKQIMEIFLNVVKKKNLNNQVFYQYQKNRQNVLRKTKIILLTLTKSQIQSFRLDLKQLAAYMEDILIEKTALKLKQIQINIDNQQNYCKNYSSSSKNHIKLLTEPEVYNFLDDILRLEERYGPLRNVSRLSRARFQQLTQTQNAIKLSSILEKNKTKIMAQKCQ